MPFSIASVVPTILIFAALAIGLYFMWSKNNPSRPVPLVVPTVQTMTDMSTSTTPLAPPTPTARVAPPYTLQVNLTKPYKDNVNLITVTWRNPPPNIKELFFVYDSLKFDYTDAAFAFYERSFPDFGGGRLLTKGSPHPEKWTDKVVYINEDNLSYESLGSIEFVFPTTKEVDFLTSTRFFYIDTDGNTVCIAMPSEFTPSGPPMNYRSF